MPYVHGRYPRSQAIGGVLFLPGQVGDVLGTVLAALEDIAGSKILDPQEFANHVLEDIEKKFGLNE